MFTVYKTTMLEVRPRYVCVMEGKCQCGNVTITKPYEEPWSSKF